MKKINKLLIVWKKIGSSGLAVGLNQGLPHQNSTNEFSLFFGYASHESFLVHGFVTD